METVSLAAISRVELEEFVHKEDRVQWVQTSVDVHTRGSAFQALPNITIV